MNTIGHVDRAPAKIVVSTILLSKPGIILSVAFTGFAGMVLAIRERPRRPAPVSPVAQPVPAMGD